ncbi:DNA repair protein RecO [Striga asiatica]|uniref:DNA repair protein RecO n=1 Tax=Striga asiatica TaxID=4170 RepID=A0A5A7PWH6_STRAF|nr:DNA repair protein RecO [Striga asiatica]
MQTKPRVSTSKPQVPPDLAHRSHPISGKLYVNLIPYIQSSGPTPASPSTLYTLDVQRHESQRIVPREAARRRRRGGVGENAEEFEGGAGGVELVARVAGEVEAEGSVVVEHGGVGGAIDEGEDGVRRRRDGGGLDLGQGEVAAGLEDGARAGGGEEEKARGGAVEGAAELGSAAAVVDGKGKLRQSTAAAGDMKRRAAAAAAASIIHENLPARYSNQINKVFCFYRGRIRRVISAKEKKRFLVCCFSVQELKT